MSYRDPARLILPVWGRRYVEALTSLTLPALLAPGNLPALSSRHDLSFVLLTETRHIDRLSASGAVEAIRQFCTVEIRNIDDLVATRSMYGMSLTHAMHRGFSDLGDGVRKWTLYFLNADFVLAEGAGTRLLRELDQGAGAVLAPSYCVVAESAAPSLQAFVRDGVLRIEPRQMARIALDHRHDTVAARTVNDDRFHMPVADQFYWAVDNDTLAGRQLPPATLAIRPERMCAEPLGFWDHAGLRALRPDGNWSVIGDSDELAMIELREASYAVGELLPGGMSPGQAAASLSSVATTDHRRLGREPLLLHAEAVAPGQAVQEPLEQYLHAVYGKLTGVPPAGPGHPLWVSRTARFEAARGGRKGCEESGRGGLLRRVHSILFGNVPVVRPWHPLHATLRLPLRALQPRVGQRGDGVVCVVSEGGFVLSGLRKRLRDANMLSPVDLLEDEVEATCSERETACVLELNRLDMRQLPDLLARLKLRLVPGAPIVVMHVNIHDPGKPFPVDTAAVRSVLEPAGYELRWSAEPAGSQDRLLERYARGLDRAGGGVRGAVSAVLLLLRLVPRSLAANRSVPVYGEEAVRTRGTVLVLEAGAPGSVGTWG